MAASAAEWAALARAYQRDSRRVAWFAEESLRLYEPPPERIDAVETGHRQTSHSAINGGGSKADPISRSDGLTEPSRSVGPPSGDGASPRGLSMTASGIRSSEDRSPSLSVTMPATLPVHNTLDTDAGAQGEQAPSRSSRSEEASTEHSASRSLLRSPPPPPPPPPESPVQSSDVSTTGSPRLDAVASDINVMRTPTGRPREYSTGSATSAMRVGGPSDSPAPVISPYDTPTSSRCASPFYTPGDTPNTAARPQKTTKNQTSSSNTKCSDPHVSASRRARGRISTSGTPRRLSGSPRARTQAGGGSSGMASGGSVAALRQKLMRRSHSMVAFRALSGRARAAATPPISPSSSAAATTSTPPGTTKWEPFRSTVTAEILFVDRISGRVRWAVTPASASSTRAPSPVGSVGLLPPSGRTHAGKRAPSAGSFHTIVTSFDSQSQALEATLHASPPLSRRGSRGSRNGAAAAIATQQRQLATRLRGTFFALRGELARATAAGAAPHESFPDGVERALRRIGDTVDAAWAEVEAHDKAREAAGDIIGFSLGARGRRARAVPPGSDPVVDIYRAGACGRIDGSSAISEGASGHDHGEWNVFARNGVTHRDALPLPSDLKNRPVRVEIFTQPVWSTASSVTTLTVGPDDTAEKLIYQLMQRRQPEAVSRSAADGYALRVAGADEWVYGSGRLFETASVRAAIRAKQRTTIQLVLMQRPKQSLRSDPVRFDAKEQPTRDYLSEYVNRHSPGIPGNPGIAQPSLHPAGSRRLRARVGAWRTASTWPARDTHTPLYVDVLRLRGLGPQGLPRVDLDAKGYPRRPVFVHVFLIHGDRKILFDERTDAALGCEWHARLRSRVHPPCLISSVPPAARLAVVVRQQQNAKDISAGSTVLGWAVIPLFAAGGSLVQGRVALRLWPEPRGNSSAERDRSYSWIYSAPTRDNNLPRSAALVRSGRPQSRRAAAGDASGAGAARDGYPAVMHLSLPRFRVPVCEHPLGPVAPRRAYQRTLSKDARKRFLQLERQGIAQELTTSDTGALWAYRGSLGCRPALLPLFARAVRWEDRATAAEARRLITDWCPPRSVSTALQLLAVPFAEPLLRRVAIRALDSATGIQRNRRTQTAGEAVAAAGVVSPRTTAQINEITAPQGSSGIYGGLRSDAELEGYLLQLIQALKAELHHESDLSALLVRRALAAPRTFGHRLFWLARAEMAFAHPGHAERLSLVLEEFLVRAPVVVSRDLAASVRLVEGLADAASAARAESNVGPVGDAVRRRLEALNRCVLNDGEGVRLPLDSRLVVGPLRVSRCRVLSSKMRPLWLVFRRANAVSGGDGGGGDIQVIFKEGDDLRQDMLTLQILRVLDRLWLSAGLSMRLSPYNVVATGVSPSGDGLGMIEVVKNAETTSQIQVSEGGGAMGAFSPKVIERYLRRHNPQPRSLAAARDTFARSCAGYCVATFVLGIGDRHSDNIMCTKDGRLFHIDFGHFLGNFKSKFGFCRERTPFVFTPEMAFVLCGGGGRISSKSEPYKRFLRLARDAFRVVRRSAVLLETLFLLMVGAGMPELAKASDVRYLKDQMFLGLGDREANGQLEVMIKHARKDTYRRIDNYLHAVAHGTLKRDKASRSARKLKGV